jgi:hypothetical protein
MRGIRIRLVLVLTAGVLSTTLASASRVVPVKTAIFKKAELGERFLLQVSYEQKTGLQDFRTSRSRIVTFERDGAVIDMLDVSDPRASAGHRISATIPIRDEDRDALYLDLNEGFDTLRSEEDRTGEDYYGRIDRHDGTLLHLFERKAVSISYHDAMLVFDQEARIDDHPSVLVHYYLTPYNPAPEFQPFEMRNLRHFGFYETYPQWRVDRWVLYAMKFNIHTPIVFALSSAIPERHRAAVRDGVLYWNRAFGTSVVRAIDAPPGVRAPSPAHNVIQWASGDFASTSYIQSDPLTGQILHAYVFVLPETMMDGDLEQQNDHLRYIVAHEIGHALGLRHNFALGAATTVMGYFKLPEILRMGQQIRVGAPALAYDRAVVRHVYLGAGLDLHTLPPFCTDSQEGCVPFLPMPKESEGMRGGATADGHPPGR